MDGVRIFKTQDAIGAEETNLKKEYKGMGSEKKPNGEELKTFQNVSLSCYENGAICSFLSMIKQWTN